MLGGGILLARNVANFAIPISPALGYTVMALGGGLMFGAAAGAGHTRTN